MTMQTVLKDDALYLGDNGACYCGEHSGNEARYTGRDISGQPVAEVGPEVAREAVRMGIALRCEEPGCGRRPSLLVRS